MKPIIAIVGRPNVGKSTLLNRMVGQKVAIVSSRPQTTRNRVLGVLTKGECQMVFLDTPGLHAPKNKLGDFMMRQADSAVRSVDLAVLVVEPSDKTEEAELAVLRRCGCPVLLAINKIDTVKKETLLSVIAAYAAVFDFAAVVPISALTGEGVEELWQELASRLEEGPAFFPEDAVTDQTERQLVAEFIREKALRTLDKEVPHGIAVTVERFKEREDKNIIDIDANDEKDFFLSAHEGEEFIMVLKGELEISYGKSNYRLKEGDTIYYDSIVPHHVHTAEGQAAQILAVVYTPV